MRIGIDIGGTCTDFVLETDTHLFSYKFPTTTPRLVDGVIRGLTRMAEEHHRPLADFLSTVIDIVHGTTVATNALLTGSLARTALLVTEGHRDILVLREAGRFGLSTFDHRIENPAPYIPRELTFEVPERIDATGAIVRALDESRTAEIAVRLKHLKVEAVGVCLLWSIVNNKHEARVAALLREHVPGIEISLSHQVNPCLREYRRASSTAIDASLKPRVGAYLEEIAQALTANGFTGKFWLSTSEGTIAPVDQVTPIHLVRSGPALGPVAAARALAQSGDEGLLAILIDAGGTTLDVSVLREGRTTMTQETWIGIPYLGHMTGFSAVDVRSIGAGGGSIARVDGARGLRIGPQSAGADPGPASYGLGGTCATVTDAAVVLGLQDLTRFIDLPEARILSLARQAIGEHVGRGLALSDEEAARAIFQVFVEDAATAVVEMTLEQGIDPRGACLVVSGGLGGLLACPLGRRLQCARALFPATGAVNCAAGGLVSEIRRRFSITQPVISDELSEPFLQTIRATLRKQCLQFAELYEGGAESLKIDTAVLARYEDQSWEIPVAFDIDRDCNRDALTRRFHETHERHYHHRDACSKIVFLSWQAVASLSGSPGASLLAPAKPVEITGKRTVKLSGDDRLVDVIDGQTVAVGDNHHGPLIVETPLTTIWIDDESSVAARTDGAFIIEFR